MKTVSIFLMTLLMAVAGASFGQVAKYQPKVIILFLGEKNPTFDESKYPDLSFYYTPELELVKSEKAKSQSSGKKAFGSLTGFSSQSSAEANDEYTGTPAEIINLAIGARDVYLFDKKGVFSGKLWGTFGDDDRKLDDWSFLLSGKKKTVVTGGAPYDTKKLGDFAKDFVKKGKTTGKVKNAKVKKGKQPTLHNMYGEKWPDFKVQDASGKEVDFSEITSGNPLTMVCTLYLEKDYDMNKAKESGEGKSGKEYMNSIAEALATDKAVSGLSNLESQIFKYRVER